MPVYLRKNINLSPPVSLTSNEFGEDYDEYFIKDPDQLRDQLPQPYRMIDKLITQTIDEAWEIISYREQERITEASKIRPPQYECAVQLQEQWSACSLCSSPDGKYVILGLTNGLAVVDAVTSHTTSVWDADGMEITELHAAQLGEDQYVISTIDIMGVARVFAVAAGKAFLVETISEQEAEKKMIAGKCQASQGGEYIGVFMENAQGKECILEIHKVPKDTWQKELEGLTAKAKPDKKATSPQPGDDDGEAGGGTAVEGEDQSTRSQSPLPDQKVSFKFTPMTLVLRVKPPSPLTGVHWSSPMHLAKTIDTGDVIGTGATHQLSKEHLEQRKTTFDHQHANYMHYLPKETPETHTQPTFHFLTGGRMMPHGLDNAALQDQPTAVCVWWAGENNLMFYSLSKNAKEKLHEDEQPKTAPGHKTKHVAHVPSPDEHLEYKPELVWPQAHDVTTTAVSADSSLIAIALNNGCLVIWDKHLGMVRRIVSISENSAIKTISFLDPSVCPQDSTKNAPYGTHSNVYAMVWCQGGELFLVNCGLGNNDPAQEVKNGIEMEEEMFSKVIPVDGIPQLIVTCRENGRIFIHDILRGSILCEITLPKTHELACPWEPQVAIGGKGQMLFIRVAKTDIEPETAKETTEDTVDVSATENTATDKKHEVFVFTLRSFPTLDKYRTQERPVIPYTIHSTMSERMDALLRERMTQQTLRKSRMQERWGQMKGELELIQQIRESNKNRAAMKTAFSTSTIERSVMYEGSERRM